MCTNNITTLRSGENHPDELLKSQGWVKTKMGYYKSSGEIKDKEGFLVYVRRRNLNSYIGDFSKKSPKKEPKNPHKTRLSQTGSNATRGWGSSELTPAVANDDKYLPRLSGFSDYPSLMAIRKDVAPCLLIGFDSEWQTLSYGREMLSWQFALVYNADLVEFIFLRDGDKVLSLDDALACILDHLGCYKPVDVRKIRRYQYCPEWDDETDEPVVAVTDDYHVACRDCRYVYRKKEKVFSRELIQDMPDQDSNRDERDWDFYHSYLDYDDVDTIKVCLVCHTGEADLSGLDYGEADILRHLNDIQGGYVTLQPVRRSPRSLINVNHARIYPLTLSFADTMCHAPAGKKGLEDLGAALGIEKIDIPKEQKERMKELLQDDPVLYMEYASTDSVITMLYSSALYGYNKKPPVTITSATSHVMKDTMMQYLKCDTDEEFNARYRGLEKVKHGKFKHPERPWYIEAKSLEPISNDANSVQYFASQAYHGGYNTCTEVGYFPHPTYDYDLRNAYPTAMCLVPDIDWEKPVRNEVIRRDMSLADFTGEGIINPITPFVGYIRFEFPDTCNGDCESLLKQLCLFIQGIPL